ncbi:MAG: AraC family transcriptional regulator [Acidobacteriaceae bacterium]
MPKIAANEPQGQLRLGQFYGEVSDRASFSGITLSDLAHTCERHLPAHSHEAAFFSMMVHGDYSERIGSRSIPYRSFSTVFHPPELVHKDHIGAVGVRFFMIEVQSEWLALLQREFQRLDLSPGLCHGEAMWLANRLYLEYDKQDQLHIESLTCELLAANSKARIIRETRKPPWLAEVVEYLRAELGRPLTLEEIATKIGVHPVYLSRIFRHSFRQTLGEYLNSLRAESAREHLAFSREPLSGIAALCGFADQSHFTRTFRKITGTTPGTFRSLINSRFSRSRPAHG